MRKLGRTSAHRRALLRSQVTSFLEHGRMVTTAAKADEVSALVEQLITLAKDDTLAHRRNALSYVRSEDVVKKLFGTVAPRYLERHGGYTRKMKLGTRRGDAAPLVLLELV